MDIESLIETNGRIAERTAVKQSWFPRIFKNWLPNSDAETKCMGQTLGNQDRLIQFLYENQNQLSRLPDGRISEMPRTLIDHLLCEEKLLSDIYIVHSLPKVGGMSIAATLSANFKDATVIHVHCLCRKGSEKWRTAMAGYQKQSMRDSVVQHLQLAQKAAMILEVGSLLFPMTQKRAVICGVREPIAWALSLYFHSFTALFDRSCDEISTEMATEFIMKVLANKMEDFGSPFMSPEKWLSEELASAHDLDIFSEGFNIGLGYQIYQTRRAPTLIIRQENLSRLSEALSLLLGYPAGMINIVNENIGDSKDYAGAYRAIRDKLRFSGDFLESVYTSPYSRKFYSGAERQSFISRWKA